MKSPILGKIKNKEFVGVRKLSAEEFSRLREAIMQIKNFTHFSELLALAVLNFDDYKKSLDNYLSLLSKKTDIYPLTQDEIAFDINRKVLNFLSSVRTFLDHTSKRISEKYGEDKLEIFKKICSIQYDESFAYRFLYKLRNYAQHCGMPVGNIRILSYKDSHGNIIRKVSFCFNRDALLDEYNGWSKVKQEIALQEEYFDMSALLEEYMSRIVVIYRDTMNYVLPDVRESANLVLDLNKELNCCNCRPIIFEYESLSGEKGKLKFFDLPLKQAKWIIEDKFHYKK